MATSRAYEALLGQAAIANARLAYARFLKHLLGPDWDALAERRARACSGRCGPAPSTKNPRYRDVRYVEELIGPDTVNTMPPATLEAFKDHGRVSRTVDTPEALERAQADHARAESGRHRHARPSRFSCSSRA